MGEFPRKVMAAPADTSTLPDIYLKLKNANAEYPVEGLWGAKTYLPDFTKAIPLEQCVYRINVPGYFYRCPGGSGIFNTAAKAGVIIDRYNYKMNTSDNHFWHMAFNSGTEGNFPTRGQHNTIDGVSYASSWVEKGYKISIDFKKVSDAGQSTFKLYGENGAPFIPNSIDDFAVTSGTGCHVAILENQRENPEYIPGDGGLFVRNFGLNYFVCTGIRSCGGIANTLIPIIPGVCTTNKPSYSWNSDTGSAGRWECDAISETKQASMSHLLREISSGKYKYHETILDVEALEEAKGTYFYFYRENGNTDKFYFIPCKDGPTSQVVKPLTKIRDIANPYSCTYNLPDSSRELPKVMNSSIVGHTGDRDDVKKALFGKQDGIGLTATVEKSDSGWDTDKVGSIYSCKILINAHSDPFDLYMREIFTNSSITGHTDKFVAQKLTLRNWSDDSRKSKEDVMGHAEHKIFNPTTDGET